MTMIGHYQVMTHPSRKEVGVADLKAHLSQYLRLVREGATIIVLDRNTPVARIEPCTSRRSLSVTYATTRPCDVRTYPPEPPPPELEGTGSTELLRQDRDHR